MQSFNNVKHLKLMFAIRIRQSGTTVVITSNAWKLYYAGIICKLSQQQIFIYFRLHTQSWIASHYDGALRFRNITYSYRSVDKSNSCTPLLEILSKIRLQLVEFLSSISTY